MTTADLIIIGSGPRGHRAADYATGNGLQVPVFEELEVGGTCLNSGCIPTKCLTHDASKESIPVSELVMERKRQTIQQLRESVQTLLLQSNITLVRGKTAFKDRHMVVASGEGYQAEHIIIATGSYAKMLSTEGLVYQQGGESNAVTSTELLNIDHVPEKLCIVGAGVIGMKFAPAFAGFGSKVTIVEFTKECLSTLGSDTTKRLRKCMEKKGTEFHLQAGVKCIHEGEVTFERKGRELTVEADTIPVVTGHAANMDSSNLNAMGISYDKKDVLVDDNMETFINGIYTIGNTNTRQMLAHVATFRGFRTVNHILGKSDNIRFDIMPVAVFTHPEAASVGKTGDACKIGELNYTIRKGHYRANGHVLSIEEPEGTAKLIADEQNKIIGCHIYGAHAAELVQEISALMNMDITLDRLKGIIHTHPILGEILQDMAIGQEGCGSLQGPINPIIGEVKQDRNYRVHFAHHGA